MKITRQAPKYSTRWRPRRTRHRRRLIDLFVAKFGNHIPLVRRQDIGGYIPAKPVWQMRPLGLERCVRTCARHGARRCAFLSTGLDARDRRFDPQAAGRSGGGGGKARPDRRRARGENTHHLRPSAPKQRTSAGGSCCKSSSPASSASWTGRCRRSRRCSLRPSRPTTRGTRLSSGSRRRSAPEFRWASPRRCRTTASFRGAARRCCAVWFAGSMTTAGGIGHTLPFLIPYFYTATVIALVVVIIELIAIAWIQWRYMESATADSGRESDDRRRVGAGRRNPDWLKLRTCGLTTGESQ